MMVRLAVLFCCIAATVAAATLAAEPQHAHEAIQHTQHAQVAVPAPAAKLVYAEQESPAHYEYEYSVKDPHSGDDKQMKENRSGDEVRGFYAFVQSDGVRRIVEYSSSKEHGFNAVVRYEGQPAPAPAKVTYAAQAPVAYTAAPAAPVAYAAPLAPVAYAQAPVPRIAYAPTTTTQLYYAPAQPAPFTLNTAQAAQVAHTEARIAYAPAPVAQVTYSAPPPPVAYAPTPAPVAYAAQPVVVAPEQRIAYASAPRTAYTQANVVYVNQPQVAYSQAPNQGTYNTAPVAYAQAPLPKIATKLALVSYAAAPVAKLAYAQPTGHITYAH